MIQTKAKALGALIAVLALSAVLVGPATALAQEGAPAEAAPVEEAAPISPVIGKGVHPDWNTDFGNCHTAPGAICFAEWTMSHGYVSSSTSYSNGDYTQTTQYCAGVTCRKAIRANPNSPSISAIQVQVSGPDVSLIYVGPPY